MCAAVPKLCFSSSFDRQQVLDASLLRLVKKVAELPFDFKRRRMSGALQLLGNTLTCCFSTSAGEDCAANDEHVQLQCGRCAEHDAGCGDAATYALVLTLGCLSVQPLLCTKGAVEETLAKCTHYLSKSDAL